MQKRLLVEEVAGFELSIFLPISYFQKNDRYPSSMCRMKAVWSWTPLPADPLFPGGSSFSGGAKYYLQTLVERIKPWIDEMYRTLPARENTAIAGCSFGGLVSAYAYYGCSNTFGKSALLSASFWYEGFVEYMRTKPLPRLDHRMYRYTGELEGVYKTTIQLQMVALTTPFSLPSNLSEL